MNGIVGSNLMKLRNSRSLMFVAVMAGFVLVATLVVITGPDPDPQVRLEKAWPVSITTANPGSLSPTLVTYGKVESRALVILKTSITAPVMELLVSEGDWVNQGEVLVRLDSREQQLALVMAEADLKRQRAQLRSVLTEFDLSRKLTAHHRDLKQISESKLKRHLDLYSGKMISDAILDEVRQQASERSMALEQHLARVTDFPNIIQQQEASVSEAMAMKQSAEIDLAQTQLQAPFDGRVIDTMVALGDRVFQGTPLIRIADYSDLEIRVSIPAHIGAALRSRLNDGVIVTASAVVDDVNKTFVLERISGDVKVGQAGIDAFFKPDGPGALDIGRVVSLNVTLPLEHDVVALPIQSIYENNRIYRVVDDRLLAVEVVQVGDHVDSDGSFRILVRANGISSGDRLITTQLPRAITGLLVEPIDTEKFNDVFATTAK